MIDVGGLVAVIVFYIVILLVGIWAGRKNKVPKGAKASSDDVLLAGRNIGYFVGFFTMVATWVGGGYINGSAEVVFRGGSGGGLIWCQAPLGYALSLLIAGKFFIRKMRKKGYVTMIDPFQQKFGKRMGGLLFIPALMGEVFWSAAILSALGATITVIVGLNDVLSIIVSACIAVLYTMFGGLYSVAYTDVVQLICIFIGLWICIPFALVNEKVRPLSSTSSEWLGKLDTSMIGTYVDGYLVLLLGGIPWQCYFQRVLSAKTTRGAEIVSYAATLGCAVMVIPSVLIGAIARSTDWSNTTFGHMPGSNGSDYEARLVLPLVLQNLTPSFVAYVGLGAVSAAVMSSADSSILSASSMFARNIYKFVIRKQASEREILIVIKVAVFGVGAMATGMGILIPSVYGLWFLCSDLVYCVLFPQLLLVLYFKRVNTYGSLAGYVTGFALRLLGGEPVLGLPPVIYYFMVQKEDSDGDGIVDTVTQLFPFRTLIMLISLIVIVLVSLLAWYVFVEWKVVELERDVFKCFPRTDAVDVKFAIFATETSTLDPGSTPVIHDFHQDSGLTLRSSQRTKPNPSKEGYDNAVFVGPEITL